MKSCRTCQYHLVSPIRGSAKYSHLWYSSLPTYLTLQNQTRCKKLLVAADEFTYAPLLTSVCVVAVWQSAVRCGAWLDIRHLTVLAAVMCVETLSRCRHARRTCHNPASRVGVLMPF